MKVLLLGNNSLKLKDIIENYDDETIHTNEPLRHINLDKIDFLISYGYRYIIEERVVSLFQDKAINLHISYLPWNRGADPNLWSFLTNTPKGVTIHYIDSKIDTGDIIIQREVYFSDEETLRSSYAQLSQTIEQLFTEYWSYIRENKVNRIKQQGHGSYHAVKNKEPYAHLLYKGWDTPVNDLKGKALK